MTIQLRKITRDNWYECVKLSTSEEQKGYVASNAISIAQAYIEPTYVPLAIYDDHMMVGFIMHGRDAETGFDWIIRLMIDAGHQGRGYGRAAMIEALSILKQLPDSKGIKISYVPGNGVAERLYADLGFRPTGEVDDGEIVAQLRVNDP
jgi:diamine N-acetyltransferase